MIVIWSGQAQDWVGPQDVLLTEETCLSQTVYGPPIVPIVGLSELNQGGGHFLAVPDVPSEDIGQT